MEVEVRTVGGLNHCFACLPVSLIDALLLSHAHAAAAALPPVLALELSSRSGLRWHLAWSGSASSSHPNAIEISQQLAASISLPDRTVVSVKAAASLPKAERVVIEPNTEDDWEIMELNSEVAEGDILTQIAVVHEGMRFPLWFHKHTVVEFAVVSTSPRKPVVQLVSGTEVEVAPKQRRRGKYTSKALLRVQSSNVGVVDNFKFEGLQLEVLLTSAIFVHPETAKKFSFESFQLVAVFPKLGSNQKKKNKSKKSLPGKDSETKYGKETSRHLVAHLLFSDTVAKGHIILPPSLCYYLKSHQHSWVYVKGYDAAPKKDASLILSPCVFRCFEEDEAVEGNSMDYQESHSNIKAREMRVENKLVNDQSDWTRHDNLIHSLSFTVQNKEISNPISKPSSRKEIVNLIKIWLVGQQKVIALHSNRLNQCSITLSGETLIHLKVTSVGIKIPIQHSEYLEKKNTKREPSDDILFVLKDKENLGGGQLPACYELSFKSEYRSLDRIEGLELSLENLVLGDPTSFETVRDISFDKNCPQLTSLSWMEDAASDVINRLEVLLSPPSGKLLSSFGFPLPGHILIYGPSGSGKTLLMAAVAKHLEGHKEILAHVVFISCSKLSLEKSQSVRQALSGHITDALQHWPSLVIFDDLDAIVSPPDSEGSQISNSIIALVDFLADIMDEYAEKWHSTCGVGQIAFMASVQSLDKLPKSLSSSGRLDFHVQLPAPAVSERGAILKHEVYKRSLECEEEILFGVASKCDGFDAYDLEILVDRAVHTAMSRIALPPATSELKKHALLREDFSQAMHDFIPVSMRGVAKKSNEGGRAGWEDVGGLIEIRNAIQEMIELPSKFPKIFSKCPLRLRSNVLLYGPPGCGKTHIVGAAAAACSLRFISVKGPELLNKYIGASEQAVRDIFSKAAAAAPCLLFFDEFDSIAPKRGHDNTGVTDRVVNQLLTELDGVEMLTGVFVFAATSRPDLLDAALLRPGRLDRLLFCDFPTWRERLEILSVLSHKLPLSAGVTMESIASMTEGFSGADLQALLSDAQLASVHELLESEDASEPGRRPIITDALLKSVALKARPSVSESEKKRLYSIYNEFLELKKPVASQLRDAKGKRATLA